MRADPGLTGVSRVLLFVSVLHVGGAGLTLPRYVAATTRARCPGRSCWNRTRT